MLSNLRRRIGVLTAIAVMSALVPAMTTSTVSAAPAVVALTASGSPALYLACPASSAIPSAGFTDTTSADVDCIAYYGITQGTTATTYEPTASVARWQMALYLTRTMTETSVTLGTGADQGFTDISGKSAEIQTAINQLKQAAVTTGKTATTFAPDDNVSRQEMAMFIERMLDTIAPGPGGQSDVELVGGAATTYINSNCGGAAAACTGRYNYSDIDSGTVTVEASNAIKELFDMNIHDGVSASTFSPDADMTRAAMASFLVGAINHSNLRPAGLVLQASTYSTITNITPTMHLSYRDASFDPIVSTAVDVFAYEPTFVEGDRPFALATGLCEDTIVTTGAITKCLIDANEPTTDLVGNMAPTAVTTGAFSQATGVAGVNTYHAWTAAAATAFDNDLHSSGTTYSTISIVGNAIASDTNCAINTPAYAATTTGTMTMHFGAVTTVTCQVTNVAGSDSYVAVPKALTPITMNRTRVNTNLGGIASSSISDAEAIIGYTDATGAVTFTITGPADPAAGATVGNRVTDTVTLTSPNLTAGALPASGSSGHLVESGDGGAGSVLTFLLDYKALADVGGIVAMTQTASSGLAATASITRSVTATHHDQYGDPFAASAVTFTSTNHMPAGLVCTAAGPSVCTTNVAHGLAVGDDFSLLSTGALRATGSTPVIEGDPETGFTVAVVPDATSFHYFGSNDVLVVGTTASLAATPAVMTTTSFASTVRTTNSAGVASYAWADTESTSGVDIITGTAVGTAGSVKYYRLAASADVAEVGDAAADLDANDVKYGCVEFDAVGKDYIVTHVIATAEPLNPSTAFMQFTYDDNDQFGTAGGAGTALDGTPATQAAWITAMTTACAVGAAIVVTGLSVQGGTMSSIANMEYTNGLSTDIQRHVLG